MSVDDDLRDLLNSTAQEISRLQTNPRNWLSWMVYLLAQLEDRAAHQSAASRESYASMITALQDEIRNRLRTGGWN